MATYVVVNKPFRGTRHWAKTNFCIVFMWKISEFKVQLTRTTPPIIAPEWFQCGPHSLECRTRPKGRDTPYSAWAWLHSGRCKLINLWPKLASGWQLGGSSERDLIAHFPNLHIQTLISIAAMNLKFGMNILPSSCYTLGFASPAHFWCG
jgi:hypothetical protein